MVVREEPTSPPLGGGQGACFAESHGAHVSWAAAFIMLLSVVPQFFYFSPDDLSFAVVPDANLAIGEAYASSGRYVSAVLFSAMRACHIDALRDYPVMAALCAASFGWFVKVAVRYLLPSSKSPFIPVIGALLFCAHGFQLDIGSFKLQYGPSAVMYGLMAVYLSVASRTEWRWQEILAALGLLVAMNLTYQPASMAVAWLAVGKALIEASGAQDAGVAWRARVRCIMRRLAATGTLVVLAGGAFLLVSRWGSRALAIPLAKAYARFDHAALAENVRQHVAAIAELVRPVPDGVRYGLMNGGVLSVLWGALVVLMVLALLRAGRWRAAGGAVALALALVVLAQNPQNLLMATYWPSPRSSFYASMITPVLAAAACAALGRAGLRPVVGVIAMAALLEVGTTARLYADRHELMRRDIQLATRVAAMIAASPEAAGAKGVRLPRDGWRPYRRYFAGVTFTGFGANSLFASPWAHSALLMYVSGISLPRTGDSTCPEEPEHLREPSVRREGDDMVVCF